MFSSTPELRANLRARRLAGLLAALAFAGALVLAACSGSTGSTTSSGSASGGASSGSSSASSNSGGTVSFANEVLPILQSRCGSCHGSGQTQAGLDLTSYSAVMAGSMHGAGVSAGDANSSTLIQMIASGRMPKRGPSLQPNQIQTITNWVAEGAPNN